MRTLNALLGPEKLGELGRAERENAFDVGFDEESSDQWTTEDGISHLIGTEGAGTAFCETMFMNPTLVRTFDLFIHESEGRFPGRDLGFPSQWYAVKADSIVDQCPDAHLDLARRDDLEAQPRWCDGSEIFSVRKKGENFCGGPGKPKLRAKQVFFHFETTKVKVFCIFRRVDLGS
jgi:hypothetical protein